MGYIINMLALVNLIPIAMLLRLTVYTLILAIRALKVILIKILKWEYF